MISRSPVDKPLLLARVASLGALLGGSMLYWLIAG
jgi:membrane protein YqaA with SNARE-associated domain